MKLCDRKLFSLLAGLLIPEDTPPPLTTTAAYLAGCLMCSNSEYSKYIVQLLYSALMYRLFVLIRGFPTVLKPFSNWWPVRGPSRSVTVVLFPPCSGRGQNMAREERVIHRLIALFK